LFFPHCDLRPQLQITRRTQQEFHNDGVLAKQLRKVINGLKDVWPFSQLAYTKIENELCYDPFHCLYGICKQLLNLFAENTDKLLAFCRATNILPFLFHRNIEKAKCIFNNNGYKPPWKLTKSEKRKVEAWVNCILVPSTYSNHFQIKNIFSQFGHLRGNSFITIFSVLMNFLNLSLPKSLPDAYKAFFSMIGRDICDLLAPSFSAEDVESLHNKVIESVCVLEGLFSEKENTFIVHEILHLAKHIPKMGPLNGWWTYAGERSMSFVKSFVPTGGGKSFDKTTMRHYNATESDITEKAFVGNFFKDNDEKINAILTMSECGKVLEYDNNKFAMIQKIDSKKEKDAIFSGLEKDHLLDCLLGAIYKICHNDKDALEKSSVFNLYYAYNWLKKENQLQRNEKIRIDTFKEFIYAVHSLKKQNNTVFCDKYFDSNSILSRKESIIKEMVLRNISTANQVYNFLEFNYNFIFYKKALIYGLHFTSRGIAFTEKEIFERDNRTYGAQNPEYVMKKSINHLDKFENWSCQYSSWCRYRTTPLEYNNNSSIVRYGQLNYFFRFYCEHDKVLHGLPIANLVPRNFDGIYQKVESEKIFLGVDKISCSRYFKDSNFHNNSDNRFVPLTNIFATAILLAPFDEQDKPINLATVKDYDIKKFYSASKKISYFLTIDLHPSKLKYCIYDPLKQKAYNKFSKKELSEFTD
jgi:hypothetical protein